MSIEKESKEIPFYDLTDPQSPADLCDEFNDYPTCPYWSSRIQRSVRIVIQRKGDLAPETRAVCEECGKRYRIVLNHRITYSSYMIEENDTKEAENEAK